MIYEYKRTMILSMVAVTSSFIFAGFCFAQDLQESENFGENSENTEMNENGENKENGEITGDNTSEISENSEAEDPDGLVDTIIFSLKNFWETRALPCLTKAGDWLSNLWQSSIKQKINNSADWVYNVWTKEIKPFVQDIIDKTKNFFGSAMRTDLSAEIEKEEQEIKQESPYLYKVIERYKGFKEYLWGTNSTSTQETNENSE